MLRSSIEHKIILATCLINYSGVLYLRSQVMSIVVYLTIAFIPAYLLDYSILIHAYKLSLTTPEYALIFIALGIVRMYMPFVGTIIAIRVKGLGILRGLRQYGLRLGKLRYILLGSIVVLGIYALSVLFAILAQVKVVNPIMNIGRFGPLELWGLNPLLSLIFLVVVALLAGLTVNAVAALGEEMGWRGFLLDELSSRMGLLKASVIIGIVWSLWHAPLILAGYDYPHHHDFVGLGMFTLICIVWSIILGYLRVLSSSVIAPSVMHGTINAMAGLILLTIPGDELYTAPLGIIGLVASATIALVMMLMFKEKIRIET